MWPSMAGETSCYHGRRNQSLQKKIQRFHPQSLVLFWKDSTPLQLQRKRNRLNLDRQRNKKGIRRSCEPESGTAMASVSSYRAAREDFSSRHSRPLQFVDLTRLLGASPALRGGRDKESTRSGEKLAEAAGPLVLCSYSILTHTWAWQAKHGRE